MPVAGQLFIGSRKVSANRTFRATNPATGEALPPDTGAALRDDAPQRPRRVDGRYCGS